MMRGSSRETSLTDRLEEIRLGSNTVARQLDPVIVAFVLVDAQELPTRKVTYREALSSRSKGLKLERGSPSPERILSRLQGGSLTWPPGCGSLRRGWPRREPHRAWGLLGWPRRRERRPLRRVWPQGGT